MDSSIKEYLERLNAMLDAYTDATRSLTAKVDALVVSWATSTPAVVHNPPSPTPSSESTTDASTPVPDVSCSTTKAQEVLEVTHDAPPACIATAPMTCSTDCSTQVVAHASVNEVRVAAIAICPEPVLNLNDKEVDQLAPARPTPYISTGTFSITEEVAPYGATTTDVDPKAGVQEIDALPLFSINTSTLVTNEEGQSVVLTISSDLHAPVLTTCSTKCSRRAARFVLYPVVTPSLSALLCTNIEDILAHVLSEEELQLDDLQWHPWPPPTQVQIAENDDVLLQGKTHGCYVWWPPDQQPRRRSEFVEWIHPTLLQVFLVSSLELRSWPSGQPSVLVSNEPRGACDEASTHAGTKGMEFNIQSVFPSSHNPIIVTDLCNLSVKWYPMSSSCAKFVTTQLSGFEGIECSDTLLIILWHIDDRLAEIVFNEIELQLAVHCKEFSIEGEVYIEGEVLGSYVLPVSSLEQRLSTIRQLTFVVLTELRDWVIAI